ncbi:CRISPR-associated endoribonuclease Cas6 [Thermosipho ferrireducens]|nr:CRISPR-associated endoribonuclease Cas6 [Thermosipho ferrireducens]
MKLTFQFESLYLPFSYNRILQSLVLKWLNNEKYAEFIHNEGFKFGKRKYKLFTFSKLFGNFEIDKSKKLFIFKNQADFIVSSHDDNFMKYIALSFFKEPFVFIKNQKVEVINVQIKKFEPSNKIRVVTKSPVTVYSTYYKNGRKWVNYFSPFDQEFYKIIRENLIRKYMAFYKKEPKGSICIRHIGKKAKEQVINYKNTVVKGWISTFELEGDEELLELAFNSGIGSKNSIGFGCIDLI